MTSDEIREENLRELARFRETTAALVNDATESRPNEARCAASQGSGCHAHLLNLLNGLIRDAEQQWLAANARWSDLRRANIRVSVSIQTLRRVTDILSQNNSDQQRAASAGKTLPHGK